MTTYTVTSVAGEILAKSIEKKAAVAMIRASGGPAAATFRADEDAASFVPPEQFTGRDWAETLRATGYMSRR